MPTTIDKHHSLDDPDRLAVYLGLIHGLTPTQIDALLSVVEATVVLMRMSARQAVDRLPVGRLSGGVR